MCEMNKEQIEYLEGTTFFHYGPQNEKNSNTIWSYERVRNVACSYLYHWGDKKEKGLGMFGECYLKELKEDWTFEESQRYEAFISMARTKKICRSHLEEWLLKRLERAAHGMQVEETFIRMTGNTFRWRQCTLDKSLDIDSGVDVALKDNKGDIHYFQIKTTSWYKTTDKKKLKKLAREKDEQERLNITVHYIYGTFFPWDGKYFIVDGEEIPFNYFGFNDMTGKINLERAIVKLLNL